MKAYLGVDVGSISIKLVLIDDGCQIVYSLYRRTEGNPIGAIQKGLKELRQDAPGGVEIAAVGTTGSARYLAGVIVGADVIKNEITAHAVGARFLVPDVRTIVEIGGQDSKIIILEDSVVVDFAMNTICAAGTGSFLDAQASRLKIPIERFGELALSSRSSTNIAGRCTIFAESDMIHKQQTGHATEDIVNGLCHALVRNYLNNVAKGKDIRPPIVFLGGVSENLGLRRGFEEALKENIIVPRHNLVMGAFGAALIARDSAGAATRFRGWEVSDRDIKCTSFQCKGCPNQCEVIEAGIEGKVVSRWNDHCGKWSDLGPDA